MGAGAKTWAKICTNGAPELARGADGVPNSDMKWASALSTQPEAALAVSEAAAQINQTLDGQAPDLLVVFVAPQHRDAFLRLPRLLQSEFPGALIFGCSGGGIIGGRVVLGAPGRPGNAGNPGNGDLPAREIEGEVALSLTAAVLPGVRLRPFYFDLDEGPTDAAGWHELLGPDLQSRGFLLLPDPFSCDIEQLLGSLDAAYPDASKVGGVASGGRSAGGNAMFLDADVYRQGVIGLALSGELALETLVAQGCRPIGTPLITTRCENNLLLELNGHPALQVLRELFDSLSPADQQLFRRSLFLGTQMKDDQIEYRHGDFLIRNLMGLVPDRAAIAVGAQLTPYQAVQFHLRDADASAEDLRQHLCAAVAHSDKTGIRPAGALLFSCLGRGEGLYGTPDHDSRLIHESLGPLPLGGFFCNGELGPVGGKTFLHGYTSSIALFRPR